MDSVGMSHLRSCGSRGGERGATSYFWLLDREGLHRVSEAADLSDRSWEGRGLPEHGLCGGLWRGAPGEGRTAGVSTAPLCPW